MTETGADESDARREDPPFVRTLLRLFLGFFGGLFLGVVAYVVFMPAETPGVAFMFAFLIGATAVGFGAFSRRSLLRVLAWAAGGAGFGDSLLATIVGGLGAGDVLTEMGIVMAFVGAVIGFRTVPPTSNAEREEEAAP